MPKYDQLNTIIAQLHLLADPSVVQFKSNKFGIKGSSHLGIYHKQLKELAKEIVKSDTLALALFDTGIYEARILCSKLLHPRSITPDLIDRWISIFDTWEICDSFCMSFIGQTPYAYSKIFEYESHPDEFQKRAAYTLMVGYHFGHKNAPNQDFLSFIPLIKKAATDERNFVKKAVNWALRTIGKRNKDLNTIALACARELLELPSKSATWIAKDAIRELSNPELRTQDYPRAIYRH